MFNEPKKSKNLGGSEERACEHTFFRLCVQYKPKTSKNLGGGENLR